MYANALSHAFIHHAHNQLCLSGDIYTYSHANTIHIV